MRLEHTGLRFNRYRLKSERVKCRARKPPLLQIATVISAKCDWFCLCCLKILVAYKKITRPDGSPFGGDNVSYVLHAKPVGMTGFFYAYLDRINKINRIY